MQKFNAINNYNVCLTLFVCQKKLLHFFYSSEHLALLEIRTETHFCVIYDTQASSYKTKGYCFKEEDFFNDIQRHVISNIYLGEAPTFSFKFSEDFKYEQTVSITKKNIYYIWRVFMTHDIFVLFIV